MTVAWIVVLIVLVGTTANPVTINRVQILQADYVVSARPVDRNAATFRVEREWKQSADLGSIRIEGLPERPRLEDRLYLIPLTRTPDGRLQVTQGDLPNPGEEQTATSHVPAIIYPASDEALDQLKTLLDENPPSEK